MLNKVRNSLYDKYEKSKLNIVLNVIIGIIIVALLLEILFAVNYTGIYVIGDSMKETLIGADEYEDKDSGYMIADENGDYVYVNKNATPTYGDIVVVNKTSQTTIIKRVIALGGDYVKLDHGQLYIKYSRSSVKYTGENGFVAVNEDEYVTHNSADKPINTFYNDNMGYYVNQGCVFLLGDNRDESSDSRAVGNFKLSSVYGVVTPWSLKFKGFFTAMHKYFSFDLPRCFGIDNRIKRKIT